MKVIAFNGSPKPNGNTARLIKTVFQKLEHEGIETEMLQLGGTNIKPCIGCRKCKEVKNQTCPAYQDDMLNDWVKKMISADGIIIGSPTYFCNITAEVTCLIDRAGSVALGNDCALKYKVGATVVAARRAGAINCFDTINKFFFINQMFMPGSVYWHLGIGREPGEVNHDEEGIKTMNVLGENMAWLLKKIRG